MWDLAATGVVIDGVAIDPEERGYLVGVHHLRIMSRRQRGIGAVCGPCGGTEHPALAHSDPGGHREGERIDPLDEIGGGGLSCFVVDRIAGRHDLANELRELERGSQTRRGGNRRAPWSIPVPNMRKQASERAAPQVAPEPHPHPHLFGVEAGVRMSQINVAYSVICEARGW
jgi:hypothetical protein